MTPRTSDKGDRPTWDATWRKVGRVGSHKHLSRVSNNSGTVAVFKEPRDRGRKALRRFADEAVETYALRFNEGVLRALDIDADRPAQWYVTELATPLSEHLGDSADLRTVVEATAQVADTLAHLSFAHRDIKPDNLFWARGRAVVGDFGIAAWPTRPGLTRVGEKVGPANFIAPEMRSAQRASDARKADVYSLAKTLFALAVRPSGGYPPDGTHHIGRFEFSLYRAGGRPALRPSMKQFHSELIDWLKTTPLDQGTRPAYPAFRTGWGPEMDAEVALLNRRLDTLKTNLHAAGRDLAAQLNLTPEEVALRPGRKLRGSYPSTHPNPDWEPDGFVCLYSRYLSGGKRVVLAGALDSTSVTYLAEIQCQNQTILWSHSGEAAVEAPSGKARLAEIVRNIADQLTP